MNSWKLNFQKQLKHYMLDMKVSMNGGMSRGCLGGVPGLRGKVMTLKADSRGSYVPDRGRIATGKKQCFTTVRKRSTYLHRNGR